MSTERIELWSQAYIRAQLEDAHRFDGEHPDWWAIEDFMYAGTDRAPVDDCWQTILMILESTSDDKALGILAAGPLEDLIEDCGTEVIDRIELEARRNPKFRSLLAGVWQSGPPDVWERIKRCRGEPW